MMGFLRITKLDFFTMKSQLSGYVSLALIIMIFSFLDASLAVVCISGAWFVALVSSNIFAIQEKNKLDHLYGSVSVGLRDIVFGRYTFMILNYLLSFFAIIVIYFFFKLIGKNELNYSDIVLDFSLSFLVYSIITGTQMPMFFKMGYTKAKMWSLVPFMVVMALVVIPFFIPVISDMFVFLYNNQAVLIVGSILVSCAVQFLSYRIALIAYRKRN